MFQMLSATAATGKQAWPTEEVAKSSRLRFGEKSAMKPFLFSILRPECRECASVPHMYHAESSHKPA